MKKIYTIIAVCGLIGFLSFSGIPKAFAAVNFNSKTGVKFVEEEEETTDSSTTETSSSSDSSGSGTTDTSHVTKPSVDGGGSGGKQVVMPSTGEIAGGSLMALAGFGIAFFVIKQLRRKKQ